MKELLQFPTIFHCKYIKWFLFLSSKDRIRRAKTINEKNKTIFFLFFLIAPTYDYKCYNLESFNNHIDIQCVNVVCWWTIHNCVCFGRGERKKQLARLSFVMCKRRKSIMIEMGLNFSIT